MAEPTKGDYPHHRASTDLRCDDQSRGPVAACYEPSDVHNELHLKAAASNKDGICTFATALQQLYRGCELLQEVLYAFREVAYPFNVSKVVFEDGKLHVHEAASNPGDGPLYSLPEHLVHDPDHRKALLAYYACCDAPAYLCELLKKVLKGITSPTVKLVEKTVRIKNTAAYVNAYMNGHPQRNYNHVLLVLTLMGGEEYAIDLTAAQLDIRHAVIPWHEYQAICVERELHSRPFGDKAKHRESLKGDIALMREEGDFYRTALVHMQVKEAMNCAVARWEKANRKTIAAMLNGEPVDFEADKATLLAAVKSEMRDYVQWWKAMPGKFVPARISTKTEGRGEWVYVDTVFMKAGLGFKDKLTKIGAGATYQNNIDDVRRSSPRILRPKRKGGRWSVTRGQGHEDAPEGVSDQHKGRKRRSQPIRFPRRIQQQLEKDVGLSKMSTPFLESGGEVISC